MKAYSINTSTDFSQGECVKYEKRRNDMHLYCFVCLWNFISNTERTSAEGVREQGDEENICH